MLGRADLRLLPAAVLIWVLAAVGILASVRGMVAAFALILAVVGIIVLLSGRRELLRVLGAHVLLVVVGIGLLIGSVGRFHASLDALGDAASRGGRTVIDVRALEDAAVVNTGPEWSRGTLSLRGRTEPTGSAAPSDGSEAHGTAGGAPAPSPLAQSASVTVILRGAAGQGLERVHRGDVVRTTGTVRVDGSLVIIRVKAIEVIRPQGGLRATLRAAARRDTAGLPEDEAALVRGMSTGDTTGLSATAKDAMTRAGISHLVAVSGANIAIVLVAVMGPLLLIGVRRRVRLALGAIVVAAYVLLVGEEPSVLRAATMAVPLLVARWQGIRASPVVALSATIAVWSLASPQTSVSVGFVLSALATGAILLAAPPAARTIVEISRERIPHPAALVIAVPLVAQVACTPILLLLSPEVSAWSVAVNIAVAPLVAPATVIGLAALVIGPLWPSAASALDTVAAGAAHLILLIATFADGLPGARIEVPGGATGAVLAAGVAALSIIAIRARHHRAVRWAITVVVVATLAPPIAHRLPLPGAEDDSWTVGACAVGQGDAVVLRGPPVAHGDRAVVLIDTGPEADALTSCLDDLSIDTITLLVLTHPHADHIGGIAALTGSRAPAQQWVCPTAEGQAAARPPGAAQAVTRGVRTELAGFGLEVLWPVSAEDVERVAAAETSSSEQGTANDCSVVLAATWPDGTRFVGLGDLEPAAQRALALLRPGSADIVKVAHHGSRRQDAGLYAQLTPRTAIIEVGSENTFGHPAPATLTLLDGLGAPAVRTDRDGTVAITPADPAATTGETSRDRARSVGPAR